MPITSSVPAIEGTHAPSVCRHKQIARYRTVRNRSAVRSNLSQVIGIGHVRECRGSGRNQGLQVGHRLIWQATSEKLERSIGTSCQSETSDGQAGSKFLRDGWREQTIPHVIPTGDAQPDYARDGDLSTVIPHSAAIHARGRVRLLPHSAAASVLALVHGEPRYAAVRIRHHPGAGRQCPREDRLAPLEGVLGACRHDGYPHQQREHANLQCRERGC